jgi:hypothetical protein
MCRRLLWPQGRVTTASRPVPVLEEIIMRPIHLRTIAVSAGLAGLATASLGIAGPSSARVVDHWTWSEDSQGVDSQCGFEIASQDHFEGMGIARSVAGADSLATAQYVSSFQSIWTNPTNGRTLTISSHSNYQEKSVRPLGGGLWSYSVDQAGQPFTITDSTGTVVLRDRGLLAFDGVYDANTDQTVSFYLVGAHGPHPGFDADLCALAADLIG